MQYLSATVPLLFQNPYAETVIDYLYRYNEWVPYLTIGSTLVCYYHSYKLSYLEAKLAGSCDTIRDELEQINQYIDELDESNEDVVSKNTEVLTSLREKLDELNDFVRNRVILQREEKKKVV